MDAHPEGLFVAFIVLIHKKKPAIIVSVASRQ
jgi:hypothetical protein